MIKTPKPQKNQLKIKRIIGHIKGKDKGPTLLFFGGIHGNEYSGVQALEHVFQRLGAGSFDVKGNLIGIRGNLPALLQGKRFIKTDLNRMWSTSKIKAIQEKKEVELTEEEGELLELLQVVTDILSTMEPPFYFVDFHTTSSKTLPFITINDALINRKFSKLFPVPIILGIEEYLQGPLLSYINEKGYVSLGFESGQHTEINAVKNSISFLWLALVFSGFLEKEAVTDFESHYRQLQCSAQNNTSFYEVVHRHALVEEDGFWMKKGFRSFEHVQKGTVLAMDGAKELRAPQDTIVFMPLYQEQGEEGFFLIQRIPKWALAWSAFLRRIRTHGWLTYLPGISWKDGKKEELLVNLRVAKFLTRPFFHLLGYRKKDLDKNHLLMQNRERTAKNDIYRNEWWYGPLAQGHKSLPL
ncbi:MAG: succinylglutamate desuccinylase/aspartoacylase family protein [Bacteroidota bacterium]